MKRTYAMIFLLFSFLLFQPMMGSTSVPVAEDAESIIQTMFGDGGIHTMYVLQGTAVVYNDKESVKTAEGLEVSGTELWVVTRNEKGKINDNSMEQLKYAIGWQSNFLYQASEITNYNKFRAVNEADILITLNYKATTSRAEKQLLWIVAMETMVID